MSIADSLRGSVTGLMKEWGRRITVIRLTQGDYSVTTGENAAPTKTRYQGWGRLGTYMDRTSEGTVVRANERVVTFVPDDVNFVPAVGDWVEVNSQRYAVAAPAIEREVGGEFVCFSIPVRNSP